jgi:hypothetical protein
MFSSYCLQSFHNERRGLAILIRLYHVRDCRLIMYELVLDLNSFVEMLLKMVKSIDDHSHFDYVFVSMFVYVDDDQQVKGMNVVVVEMNFYGYIQLDQVEEVCKENRVDVVVVMNEWEILFEDFCWMKIDDENDYEMEWVVEKDLVVLHDVNDEVVENVQEEKQ